MYSELRLMAGMTKMGGTKGGGKGAKGGGKSGMKGTKGGMKK
jgi:hypothetical protein